MAVKRALPSYFRKFIFVVGSSAISLGVLMIIVEYHNALESSLPELSVVYLDDGRRYHWLSNLWCNKTQPSRLCYYHPEDNIRGRPFHENTLRLLKKLNIFDHTERYVDPAKYLKENDPVFLTAADSAYFGPVKVAIRSVQEYFPNRTIIFYDLGMTKHEVKELKSFCNLEYVRFPFEDFPGYFRQLTQYRWKPVIVAKTLVRYGAVWYLDSSIRFTTSDLKTVYNLFTKTANLSKAERKFSFLLHSFSGHGIFSVTSPTSYFFLPTNVTMMKLRRPNCMEANMFLLFRTREAIEAILVWLLSCALEENCMSTPEATLMCKFTDDRFNDYADCHRYDQSITNLLLANLLGYNSKRWSSEVTDFFEIRRYESDDSMKPYECLLNISSNK